jgi:hypothetical protein
MDRKDWIPEVTAVEVCGKYSVRVTFDDGVTKQLNLESFLWGPMFEHLLDPAEFARVTIDPDGGTIAWPNGADFAPETLYDLPDERGDAA